MCSAGGCCDAGKNACVADGATCSSGGQCAASTCPPPAACGNGQAFSTFTKACTNSDSCSFGLHQLNCCGSQLAIGFNHSVVASFQAAEAAWEATCSACACAAAAPLVEDGKSCKGTIGASCDNGMCTTHCK